MGLVLSRLSLGEGEEEEEVLEGRARVPVPFSGVLGGRVGWILAGMAGPVRALMVIVGFQEDWALLDR